MAKKKGSGGMEIQVKLTPTSAKKYKKVWSVLSSRAFKSKLSTEQGKVPDAIRDHAKRIVPVDTGKLRASIQSRKLGSLSRGDIRHTVIATAPYASDVEYGTGSRPSKPYMRPAYRAHQAQLSVRLGRSIKDQWKRSVR